MNVLQFARLIRVVSDAAATELESWSEDGVHAAPKKTAKKSTRKQAKPAPEKSEPPEAANDNEPQEDAVTLETVKECIAKVMSEKGQQAALDLLGEFKANKMSDLAEDNFADFVVAAKKLVG